MNYVDVCKAEQVLVNRPDIKASMEGTASLKSQMAVGLRKAPKRGLLSRTVWGEEK
jgi:hypothetical protein